MQKTQLELNDQNRQKKLSRRITYILLIVAIPYFFIFFFQNQFFLAFAAIPVVLTLLSSLFWLKKGYDSIAKLTLIGCTTIAVSFYTCVLGPASGIQSMFFGIMATTMALFEPKRIRTVSLVAVEIGLYFFLEFTQYRWLYRVILPEVALKVVYFSILFFTSLTIVLVIYIYYTAYAESEIELETKNLALTNSLEEIQHANKELQAKAAIDKELTMAKDIQKNILPVDPPPTKGYHIDHLFIPAKQVSGDYYDYFPLSNHKIGIVIADIIGKGIPASLMMIAFKGLMHSTVTPKASPSQMLAQLSDAIFLNKILGKYVPVIYGILDTKANTFTYANAGHEEGMVVSETGLKMLDVGGSPLGMYETQFYEEETIVLKPNDRIVLFTDGLTDIKDQAGLRLGIEGFTSLVSTYQSKEGPDFLASIKADVKSYFDGKHQEDDMTIVTLKRSE